MWFANLSSHNQKLYGLVGLGLVVSLLLGVMLGLILFSSDAPERPDIWQESKVQPAEDTLAEFTAVSTQARWHQEGSVKAQAAVSSANEPEGFKLLGIVNRAEKVYALVMSLDATSPRKVNQLAVGDILVGNWSIREITPTKVILMAEGAKPETRELMLYAPLSHPKAPADKGAKSPKAKVERKSKPGNEKAKSSDPKQPSAKSSTQRKPKSEAEIKARDERVKAAQERARAKKANEPKK